MQQKDFTLELSVDRPPEAVFDAINDVRGWWSGEVTGPTDRVGAEFVYRYGDLHRSTQKVTELVRGRRIVWQVLDAALSFVDDPSEWAGSTIVFELSRRGGKTVVSFSHQGLTRDWLCYEACSEGWRSLLERNLAKRIATGEPQPDAFAD
jgi:uncharacterized protein YndB with AHSA1/START domain